MKWRMRLLVLAIVTAIAGAAMAGWLIARTSSPPSGPVILVTVDGLRPDRLAAYGSRRGLTPNLDSLAAESVVFERAYSHSPLTVPAHMSILSARLPYETGARGDEDYVVPEKLPLLPALLHRRGFKTAGIVSTPLLGRETGLAKAFDFFDDEAPARAPSTPPSAVHREGASALTVAEHWMDEQGTRFFLFLQLDEAIDDGRQATATSYDAAVRSADLVVGRLVQFLRSRDLFDRAVIVLLSDHGEGLGDHGEPGHGLFLYDATIRTPLLIKLPKKEGAGRRRTEVVQHVDVAATILDLMGAPRPSGTRGRSLRHLLTSNDATLGPAAVYAETCYPLDRFGWAELKSVTDGRYRLIRAPRPELYDLMQDPGERDNLADSRTDKLAEMSAVLDKFKPVATPATATALTDPDREALRALLGDTRSASAPARGANAASGSAGDSPETQAPVPADPKDRLPILEKLNAADALARDRRYADALAAYRDVEAADPGIPAAWRESGALLLAAGQAREALQAFRRLLQLRPDDAGGIAGAARALGRLGKLDDAARVAAFAARLDPLLGNELLVRLDLRRKDYAGARMAAEAAKQVDPDSPLPALAEGVELYQSGKYEEALPRLEEAVQLTVPRRVQIQDVRFYAGDTLARLRRYTDAEARLSEELKWFPESVRARESLASVYQATGRGTDILALAQDLIRSAPTADGYVAAVRLSALAGDKNAAASFRAQGRELFGEAAIRAAEAPPR